MEQAALLERTIDDLRRECVALRLDRTRLDNILANLEANIIWSQDPDTGAVLYLSPAVEAIYGYPVQAFLDNVDLWLTVLHPEDGGVLQNFFPSILREGTADVEYRIVRPDGTIRWLHDRGYVVHNPANGAIVRIDGIATDITTQRQMVAAEAQIAAQEATIRALSMPVIPISDTVLLLPLIGTLDSARATVMSEVLLEGIIQQRAQVAIIDITGLPMVDTQMADALIRSARAARLVGANVILTGVRPEVAQTLIMLGVVLSDIQTFASLKRGIQAALMRHNGAAPRK